MLLFKDFLSIFVCKQLTGILFVKLLIKSII